MAVTKIHKTSQREALSIEQHNAIDLLIYGKPDREVAEMVGVSRETVTRWRNENPYFIAGLNQKREELWRAAHDKLRSLNASNKGLRCPCYAVGPNPIA